MNVTIQPRFPEDQRDTAATLYYEAFRGKLHRLFDPPEKAHVFFAGILDPGFALSAVSEDGTLLGLAGFKTSKGALTGGTLKDLNRVYGVFGGLWRGLLASLLERDLEDGVLLMDGICVSSDARGLGLGTKLLRAIKDKARDLNCTSVRLDVIDTNPRAQSLYAREGFVPVRTEKLGPLRHLFGFSKSTRMEYAVPQQNP
jgi:ribosomal protein S18 acetylase RimI-like enzyme